MSGALRLSRLLFVYSIDIQAVEWGSTFVTSVVCVQFDIQAGVGLYVFTLLFVYSLTSSKEWGLSGALQADADVESGGTYSVSEISLADRHLVIKRVGL